MTWLEASREEIRRRGLDPNLGQVLLAFGGARAPGAADLGAPLQRGLPATIEADLAREVDADQARLFARRFRSVAELLEGLPDPEARLLRVALDRRAGQILAEARPRALRIRALVDFLWSQAALLEHARPDAPTLAELARALQLEEVAPGVRHGLIRGLTRRGPVNVNVLRARGVRLEALATRDRSGASLAEVAIAEGAVAALSGGFFLYSEPDIAPPSQRTDPVGLLVHRGHVAGPPVFARGSLLAYEDGRVALEQVGMSGVTVEIGDPPRERHVVGQAGVRIQNRAHARGARAASAGAGVALAIVGERVVARGAGSLEIPLAGFVLWVAGPSAAQVGDRVTYDLGRPGLQAAMAGGPFLLGPSALDLAAEEFCGSAPPLTFSQDETYDQNLLPRMAIGLTPCGELVAAAVDGRDREALGLTLGETAGLLATLGCDQALNLDGGSSKRMVVRGRVVDLSSTEVAATSRAAAPVRPVHSAILLFADA